MGTVTFRDVRKAFDGVEVIQGVDLEIPDGTFCVLVGPSGCGKSTLLRMIAGLEDVSGGDLLIDGEVMNDVAPARRGVSMVFQSYALYPHMTVYKNMAFGLKLAKEAEDTVDQRVREVARILQLDQLLDRKPKALSGGQRQRVAIGRAIVRNPRVFLFDEPLSNLDAALRVQMRLEIARLHRRLGTTMIHVTHDQVEAMTLADLIVVMNAGRVEQVGTPRELYDRPANTFVAGFIGSPAMNLLPARVAGGVARFEGSDAETGVPIDGLGISEGARVTVGVRPEHWEIAGAVAGVGDLAFAVEVVEDLGDMRVMHGVLAEGPEATLREPADRGTRRSGDRLAVRPVEGCVHLFDAEGGRIGRPAGGAS